MAVRAETGVAHYQIESLHDIVARDGVLITHMEVPQLPGDFSDGTQLLGEISIGKKDRGLGGLRRMRVGNPFPTLAPPTEEEPEGAEIVVQTIAIYNPKTTTVTEIDINPQRADLSYREVKRINQLKAEKWNVIPAGVKMIAFRQKDRKIEDSDQSAA